MNVLMIQGMHSLLPSRRDTLRAQGDTHHVGCIAALEKVGHIQCIHDGRWLFKALLAPKLHQEHV